MSIYEQRIFSLSKVHVSQYYICINAYFLFVPDPVQTTTLLPTVLPFFSYYIFVTQTYYHHEACEARVHLPFLSCGCSSKSKFLWC